MLLERDVILPKRRSCLALRLDEMMKEGELATNALVSLVNTTVQAQDNQDSQRPNFLNIVVDD